LAGGFVIEKPLLSLQPSGKTGEVAVRAEHTVARDDDTDRVLPHGGTDGSDRGWIIQAFCDL
jgi:hypothetical protein